MMKNIISSPYRKMKILLILPVFAIVLYAFATPDYRYISVDDNSGNKSFVPEALIKEVKGTVVKQDGNPLQGAAVVISGTTMGVTTDAKGYFNLDNVPEETSLVVSYVGFKTKVIKPVFTSDMTIKMERDTVNLKRIEVPPPPPPPPPSPPSASTITRFRSDTGTKPLIVVDGVIRDIGLNAIDPNTIESVSVRKDVSAVEKYGELGKDGVIEITTKKGNYGELNMLSEVKVTGYGNYQNNAEKTVILTEEMPVFPGGENAIKSWIYGHIKVTKGAEKISGPIYVVFTVDSKGKVRDAQVLKKEYPVWEAEAVRVVSSMPDWKPGSQNGNPIDVIVQLPIDFTPEYKK